MELIERLFISPCGLRHSAGMPAAMVTRSRSSRQHGHSRVARGAPPSLWPRLPAELLGRIAAACESGATLRAIDAVDRSLWSTRVERLLGALQGTPSEPLLLHVRHVARRAAPALVTAGALHPYYPHHFTTPCSRHTSCATPPTPHLLTLPHRALAAGVVPVLIKCIAEGDALPTGGLQSAFSSVTALLDAAKAADPKTSMLEASVAAELLQKGLLAALKVAVREEWAPERSGGRHSGAAAIGELFRLQCRLLHSALCPRMRDDLPPGFSHAPLIHVVSVSLVSVSSHSTVAIESTVLHASTTT